jgi:hypothetical protein
MLNLVLIANEYFIPINLMRSVYKILGKVLAIKMKQVLGLLISDSHNAFIGGDK